MTEVTMTGPGDLRPNVSYGDGESARRNEILRTVVGSGVHGIAIEGTDDHDEMGIFVEPPNYVIGIDAPFDQHVWRTQPEGARSGPGDTDLTIYSLRKYLRLAVQGNPTVLVPLFAPEKDLIVVTPLGRELRALAPSIISREAGERFYGYLTGQRERMTGGGKQGRVPNRPELIEKYGFDVKYASHALRLALQGVELMETGSLTLPMREHERETVLALKRGEMSFADAIALVDKEAGRLRQLLDAGDSPLPPSPDRDAVSTWAIHAHRRQWRTDRAARDTVTLSVPAIHRLLDERVEKETPNAAEALRFFVRQMLVTTETS